MSIRHTFEPTLPEPFPVTEEHIDRWAVWDFLVWLFTGHLLSRRGTT